MKKLKKQIKGMTEVSLLGSSSSIGITALGGSAAPIVNATRYMPTMGSVAGVSGLIRATNKIGKKARRR